MNTPNRVHRCSLLISLCLLPLTTEAVAPVNFEVRYNADLVALCSAPPSDPSYVAAIHYCHGVAVGFARYYEAISIGKDFRSMFCLPKTLSRNEIMAKYVVYSKTHPEYDRDAVGNVLLKFLDDTFHCPENPAAPKS